MSSDFPKQIDPQTPQVEGGGISEDWGNDRQDEISAIQTALLGGFTREGAHEYDMIADPGWNSLFGSPSGRAGYNAGNLSFDVDIIEDNNTYGAYKVLPTALSLKQAYEMLGSMEIEFPSMVYNGGENLSIYVGFGDFSLTPWDYFLGWRMFLFDDGFLALEIEPTHTWAGFPVYTPGTVFAQDASAGPYRLGLGLEFGKWSKFGYGICNNLNSASETEVRRRRNGALSPVPQSFPHFGTFVRTTGPTGPYTHGTMEIYDVAFRHRR